jgi:O-antigen ligase
MIYILTIILLTVYAIITWNDLVRGTAIILLLLPTYLLRYSIGPIPTTFLELLLLTLFSISLIQSMRDRDALKATLHYIKSNKMLTIGLVLFITGATISVATSIDTMSALGEWKAFYIEPMILSLIVLHIIRNKKDTSRLLRALLYGSTITALYAVLQHFTGWGVPDNFWANGASYRVTAWYGFPNAVALALAPIVPIALYLYREKFINKNITALTILLLVTATVFAKSTGGIVALCVALFIYLVSHPRYRKVTLISTIISILLLFSLPQLSGIRSELLLRDRSGSIRLSVWSETLELLRDRPLSGAGLASYSERIVPYHQRVAGEGIEIFHHPHNLLLTIWINTSFIGLIGFVLIVMSVLLSCLRNRSKPLYEALLYSFIIILIHGLVDSPYIKNDLSIIFWLLVVLSIPQTQIQKTTE